MPDERLSVVIPCHDEEIILTALVEALVDELDQWGGTYELIAVDDGSSDRTLDVLQGLAGRESRLRVISFSRNFGKESAMLAGLRASTGSAVVIMDADLQHPPHLIPQMIDLHGQGYDQVVAVRDRSRDPRVRQVVARSYYRAVNKIIDVPLQDGAGDFRLLSRRAVDALLSMPEANRFSKGLFSWIGFPTVAVGFQSGQRAEGGSRWSYLRLIDYGVDGVMSFNSKPLRAAVWLGLSCLLLSLLYLGWLFVQFMRVGVDSPGYLTLVAAITAFGGIQLLFLGVIGEYVGRIYYETKQRPPYVVAYDSGD